MQQFRVALGPVRRLYFVIFQLNPDLPGLVQWKKMAFMLHISCFIADIDLFRNEDIPLGENHHTISESSSCINFISLFIHSLVHFSIYWEWLCLLSIVQVIDIIESSAFYWYNRKFQYIRICMLPSPCFFGSQSPYWQTLGVKLGDLQVSFIWNIPKFGTKSSQCAKALNLGCMYLEGTWWM